LKRRGFIIQYLYFPPYLRVLLLMVLVILGFGIIIRILEPQTFTSIFDGLYWAIVTAATVGYGDFVPTTVVGKVMAIVLITFGTGFVMYFFTQIATYTVQKQNNLMEGKMSFTGEGHTIIIGWNERTKKIILELLNQDKNQTIVLVDSSLDMNPYSEKNIHFIKGEPYDDSTLRLADVGKAKKVIITADHNLLNELQADMISILILLAINGLNSNIYITVEILTPEQIINAKRAGADKIIETSSIISDALV
jgi:voltage-gated potassium channel